jgi:hypothetical protein
VPVYSHALHTLPGEEAAPQGLPLLPLLALIPLFFLLLFYLALSVQLCLPAQQLA